MRLEHIDLNQLYTLRVVLDEGGIGAAASRLGRSQPAITARIKQLEAQLGVDLFERVGRGLKLTARGEAVAHELDHLLGNVARLVDVSRSDGVTARRLRVGALPTVSAYVLAPALTSFAATFPTANIEVSLGFIGPQLDALRKGQLDVVASVGDIPPGLDAEVIGHARAEVALPRAGAPRRLSLRALRSMPLLAFGKRGDSFFDAVWQFIVDKKLTSTIRMVVPHIQTLKCLVAAGGGASILPAYTVREPDLVTRAVTGLDVRQPIWLASRRTNRDAPAVHALYEIVRACTA